MLLMGILVPPGTLCACTRALPASLELQLLLSGAEDVLHLVLGNGFPLACVFLEDVVPDDGNLWGEAEQKEGVLIAVVRGPSRGQPTPGMRSMSPRRLSRGSMGRGEGVGSKGVLWGTWRGWFCLTMSVQVK